MELKRRQSLGMYIYKNPTTAEQKEFNAVILKKAEAIRCKVYVDVINEKYEFFDKDKLKASFLEYYKEQIRNNYEKLEASYKHFEYFCDGSCLFEDIDMDAEIKDYFQNFYGITLTDEDLHTLYNPPTESAM